MSVLKSGRDRLKLKNTILCFYSSYFAATGGEDFQWNFFKIYILPANSHKKHSLKAGYGFWEVIEFKLLLDIVNPALALSLALHI